jgi:hypothetical protein
MIFLLPTAAGAKQLKSGCFYTKTPELPWTEKAQMG